MNQPLTCDEIVETVLVERYVADKLSAELTDRFEIHLLGCERCQGEVRLAWAVRKGLGATEESVAGQTDSNVIPLRTRRRIPRVAAGVGLAAAAAAILLLVVPTLRVGDPSGVTDQHRAPVSEVPSVPVPVAPVGTVEGVDQVRWTSVAIADRYRLTVLDGEGSITWEYETADTFAAFPGTVVLEEGASYYWKVDARIGFDRWIESELAAFQVVPLETDQSR